MEGTAEGMRPAGVGTKEWAVKEYYRCRCVGGIDMESMD
jgi:hypothetical protein